MKKVAGWKKNRTGQVDSDEQLTWIANVVLYVDYVHKATSARSGSKKAMLPLLLEKEVLLLGPRFEPPSYVHLRKRNATPGITPKITYLRPLNIVHPFYYPSLAKCPQCDSVDISWQGWTAAGHRDVHGLRREETALGFQLQCNPCKNRFGGRNAAEEGTYCFATTNLKFWERKEHWEIPRESPTNIDSFKLAH